MKQAIYDVTNVGHFGLASSAYLHFTSPIRRYPDVEVHRAVKRLLSGEKPDTSPQALDLLAQSATASSTRERAAMDVEREVVDLYRALHMRDRIGDVLDGTVTAVTGGGLYVSLDDPFVDVLIRYESLGPDQYDIDEDEIGVVGRRSGDAVNLGDRVTVTIEDVAIMRRAVFAARVVPDKVLAELARFEKRPRRDARGPGAPPGGRPGPRGQRPLDRGSKPQDRSAGKPRGGARPEPSRGGARPEPPRGKRRGKRR
jgi:ribonuclease R